WLREVLEKSRRPVLAPLCDSLLPWYGSDGSSTKAIFMSIGSALLSETDAGRFTHLFARITEEEDGYVVQVRLHNDARPSPEGTAWGEEIADSMESASEMIAGLAASFSIPQDRITLEIRMDDVA